MKHFASKSFWENYYKLPQEIQELSDKCYELLKENLNHPSLNFKSIGKYKTVRIGLKYRAIGLNHDGNILWIWIGGHSEYDKKLKN